MIRLRPGRHGRGIHTRPRRVDGHRAPCRLALGRASRVSLGRSRRSNVLAQMPGWFVVRGRDGAKIRLSQLLGGLGDLFEEMKRRASDEVRVQIEGATAGVLRGRGR
jgi:hypothetical protein